MPDIDNNLLDTKGLLEHIGNSAFSKSNASKIEAQQTKSLDELLADASVSNTMVSMSNDKLKESDSDEMTFHYLTNPSFLMVDNRGLSMKMTKWGFSESMLIGKWRYEENCGDMDHIVQSFFSSKSNQSTLNALGIHILDPSKCIVQLTQLSTAETSMSLFERLQEDDIGAVHSTNGHIKGRLDDNCGDIVINSVLREVLFMEESELYDCYSEKERNEFIFRIFSHLVLGGAVNQYDDSIDDYLKATKAIYRDLLSARKRDSDDEVEVMSVVYEIQALDSEKELTNSAATVRKPVDIEAQQKEMEKMRVLKMAGRNTVSGGLFKAQHDSNFCYLIVDKLMRHVTLWRHAYSGSWA